MAQEAASRPLAFTGLFDQGLVSRRPVGDHGVAGLGPSLPRSADAGPGLARAAPAGPVWSALPLVFEPVLVSHRPCRSSLLSRHERPALGLYAGWGSSVARHPGGHSGDASGLGLAARRGTRGLPVYHAYDLYYASLPMQQKYEASSDEEVRRRVEMSRATIGPHLPYFGSQKGRNLLVIKLESFSSFLINYEVKGQQQVTPFLNELCKESIWGEGEDQAADGGSSDCEFVVLNSLHPASFGPLAYHFAGNDFHGIPHLLAEEGYRTFKAVPWDGAFWNNRTTGVSYGFQEGFYAEDFKEDPDNSVGWGLTDGALYQQLLPIIEQGRKPYMSYVATLMMHHPFAEVGKEREFLKLPREFDGTMMGRYLHLARLRDEHIRQLVTAMKANGSWENTVLVLVGDHRTRMERREYERLEVPVPVHRRDRVLVLIHCPEGAPALRAPRGIGLLDVAPTLIHLFGIDPRRTVFLGRNLLAGPKRAVTRSRAKVIDQEKILYLGTRLEVSPVFDMEADEIVEELKPDPDMYQQGVEELRVSDTLLMGDRVREFIDIEGP